MFFTNNSTFLQVKCNSIDIVSELIIFLTQWYKCHQNMFYLCVLAVKKRSSIEYVKIKYSIFVNLSIL